MSKKPKKEKVLFTPSAPKSILPYDRTNAAARAIVDSENQARAEKTARLRAIRLGQEEPDDPDAKAALSKKG